MNSTSLYTQLQEDIGHAQQLLALIESEHQALLARDLATLESLIDQKQPTLALLAQHTTERSLHLKQQGYSTDRDGLVAMSHALNLDGKMIEAADQLATLIEQCRNANERNGSLVRSNQAATGKVLGLLRGTEAPNLYDQKGSASKINQARPLSQA